MSTSLETVAGSHDLVSAVLDCLILIMGSVGYKVVKGRENENEEYEADGKHQWYDTEVKESIEVFEHGVHKGLVVLIRFV